MRDHIQKLSDVFILDKNAFFQKNVHNCGLHRV